MAKKLYFKIGEACKRLDIQPYVLRYWETEFSALSPDKSKSGQRVYSEADLRVIARIKELLYDEGYTIAGAKKKLEKEDLSDLPPVGAKAAAPPKADTEDVDELASEEEDGAAADARASSDANDEAKAAAEPEPAKPGTKAAAKRPAPATTSSSKPAKKKTPPKAPKKAPKKAAKKASPKPSASEAKLRRGVREALKEAQALLDSLSD